MYGLRDNTTGKYLGHVEKEPEKLGFYPVIDGLLPERWLVDIEGLWGEKEALDILSEHTGDTQEKFRIGTAQRKFFCIIILSCCEDKQDAQTTLLCHS